MAQKNITQTVKIRWRTQEGHPLKRAADEKQTDQERLPSEDSTLLRTQASGIANCVEQDQVQSNLRIELVLRATVQDNLLRIQDPGTEDVVQHVAGSESGLDQFTDSVKQVAAIFIKVHGHRQDKRVLWGNRV